MTKNKCYGVILALAKYGKAGEFCAQVKFADSEENAIALLLQDDFVSKLLLDGYAITSKSAVVLDPSIAPINTESECIVIREFSGEARQLHIDLRNNYTDDFKRDLQAFMTKYHSTMQPIYPEFTT